MILSRSNKILIRQSKQFKNLANQILIVPLCEEDLNKGKIVKKDLKSFFLDNFSLSLDSYISFYKFKGKWLENFFISGKNSSKTYNIFILGLGHKENDIKARCREVGIHIGKTIQKHAVKNASFLLRTKYFNEGKNIFQLCLGLKMTTYKLPKFSVDVATKKAREESITLELIGAKKDFDLKTLDILEDSIHRCRFLQDLPPNIATPTYIAKEMKKVSQAHGLKTTIFDGKKLNALGFHAFLAVAKGSSEEPKFVIIEYKPRHYKKTLALVGKGVTFDTGGYSIKTPSVHQEEMKYDMSGASIVLNSIIAIAKAKLPIHVYAVAPLCENAISGSAYKVRDIVTAYDKKTIEIWNTDAEGRVILADALAYTALKLKPDFIMTHATLTGAIISALGHVGAGVFCFDDKLQSVIKKSSFLTGEQLHVMPVWDEVSSEVKGDLSDVLNIPKSRGAAGSMYAAAFLREFTHEIPFAHFDIAGVANSNKAIGYPRDYSSGYGIQLNLEIAKTLA